MSQENIETITQIKDNIQLTIDVLENSRDSENKDVVKHLRSALGELDKAREKQLEQE